MNRVVSGESGLSSSCHLGVFGGRLVIALVVLVVTAIAGCNADDPGATVDAAVPGPDAAARACDGRAYDPCTDTASGSDCMSGLTCRFFGTQNFTICIPLCDANNPCPPDENGNPVNCNQMGRCRSNAPNSCTP